MNVVNALIHRAKKSIRKGAYEQAWKLLAEAYNDAEDEVTKDAIDKQLMAAERLMRIPRRNGHVLTTKHL